MSRIALLPVPTQGELVEARGKGALRGEGDLLAAVAAVAPRGRESRYLKRDRAG